MGEGGRRKRTEYRVLARKVIARKSSKEACGAKKADPGPKVPGQGYPTS